MQKALVVLLEVRPVPGVGASDPLRALVVVQSFLVLRGAGLVALVIGWRRRATLARATPSLLFAAGASLALCVPLIVGFAYDRHSVVVIVAFLFLATGILARAMREESSGAVPRRFSAPRAPGERVETQTSLCALVIAAAILFVCSILPHHR